MDGVVIFDGNSRLMLMRIGDPEAGYPPSAYLTRVEVESGPLRAIVEAQADNYDAFLKALESLHRTLGGEARLGFWNESHFLRVAGNGKGRIVINVEIRNDPFGARLTVPMVLDQSYLPQIIAGIRTNFLRR